MTLLRRNITWMFLANVIMSACKWAMLVLITRYYNVNTVGLFSIALAISSPVYSFLNLQLRGIQATDINNKYTASQYFWFRVLSSSFGLTILLIYLMIYRMTDIMIFLLFLMVFMWKWLESLSDVVYGQFQKYENMRHIAISLISKGILSVVTIFYVASLGYEISLSIAALFTSWLIHFILYDFITYKSLLKKNLAIEQRCTIRYDALKNIFLTALPMGIVLLFHNLNLNMPKYFLAYHIDNYSVGIYSAISYTIVAGTAVIGAIGQSAMPRLAHYNKHNMIAFRSLMLRIYIIAVLIGLTGLLISYLFGDVILFYLYGSEYSKFNNVFVAVMISSTFIYATTITGCGLTAMHLFKLQTILTVITFVIIVLFSLFTVPIYGMIGAALSLASGYLFQSSANLFFIHNAIKVNK